MILNTSGINGRQSKTCFPKIFDEYDLERVLGEIDLIKYQVYGDIRKCLYGVK
ncbi:hypothetical protein rsdtw13_21550 [Clostridium sp. TW13]|uniref:Uncharacterized protein n=1 Tax=Inconstantimicrobium mannanitabidum TaxID=1604901 RepID=A0ACB5RCM4_9CLOT|nr:hypothetical protein rsdtw13_21550 [Clostridium sp. TW13]